LQKRMVQEMKAPLPAGAARESDRPREEKGTPPPHPFEYRLFDLSTPIQPSPKAAEMFEQASTYLQRFKTNLMYSAFFIWACFLLLGAVLLVVPDVLPGSISLFCGAPLAILVAWVAVNPRKSSAEMIVMIWGGLNLVGIGVIVISLLSAVYHLLVRSGNIFGLVAVIVLSIIALLSYVLFQLYLGNRVRRHTAASKGMRLLILWVFGPQQNLLTILGDIGRFWRYFGSVQFLQGGEYTLSANQIVSYLGGSRRLLVRTPEQLEERMQTFKDTPKWSGEFPVHSLLCGDVVWKMAIDAFLDKADLVAMNLCGFSRTNQGCLYELALLTDCFPTRCTLFLVDDTTDMDFLVETLKQKWDTMPADSPNHTQTAAPVWIYKLHLSNPDDRENMLKLFFEIAASMAS